MSLKMISALLPLRIIITAFEIKFGYVFAFFEISIHSYVFSDILFLSVNLVIF